MRVSGDEREARGEVERPLGLAGPMTDERWGSITGDVMQDRRDWLDDWVFQQESPRVVVDVGGSRPMRSRCKARKSPRVCQLTSPNGTCDLDPMMDGPGSRRCSLVLDDKSLSNCCCCCCCCYYCSWGGRDDSLMVALRVLERRDHSRKRRGLGELKRFCNCRFSLLGTTEILGGDPKQAF